MSHDHKYTIADDAAVHVLLDKMLGRGTRQRRREKLLKALEEASRHYQNSSQKERQAFFHGLLTGYAVALKLWCSKREKSGKELVKAPVAEAVHATISIDLTRLLSNSMIAPLYSCGAMFLFIRNKLSGSHFDFDLGQAVI